MSYYQPRAEKSEGQLRRPGPSTSSGQHRGFSGGSGGRKGGGVAGGAPPPLVSSTSSSSAAVPPPSLSTNRSFKKSSNRRGLQYRVAQVGPSTDAGVVIAGANKDHALNGAHTQASSRGSSHVPASSGAKPVDTSINAQGLPKAPASLPVSGAADCAAPTTPAKGDASSGFTLQFGTLSPGIVKGMPIPARTSSAPPNLDEQKQGQAHHDLCSTMPELSIPCAPKPQQQQTKKDAYPPNETKKDIHQSNIGDAHPPNETKKDIHQSNIGDAHPPNEIKKDIHQQIPAALPASGPTSFMLHGSDLPLHTPFHQPQIPLQFGGPIPQMHHQGIIASSLHTLRTLPLGNVPPVPQQLYLPGLQSHPSQQQAIVHQGQQMGFGPQISHQLVPQLSNFGVAVGPQFLQQQPGRLGPPCKIAVRITHPETHEELTLVRTDSHMDGGTPGQRPHSNLNPHPQSVPAYASRQINYFSPLQPNSYNPSSMAYATPSSLPITSPQMTASSQASRYNYQYGQSAQPISSMNTSALFVPASKSQSFHHPHGVPEAAEIKTTPDFVQMKPPVGKFVETRPLVAISTPVSKAEVPKLMKPLGEVTASHQQKGREVSPESSVELPKSVSELSGICALPVTDGDCVAASSLLLVQKRQLETSSSMPASPVGDSGSAASGVDARRRQPIHGSVYVQEHPGKPNRMDHTQLKQQHQADVLNASGGAKCSSVLTFKDAASQLESNNGNIHVLPSADASPAITCLHPPDVNCGSSEVEAYEAVEGRETLAVSVHSEGVLAEEGLVASFLSSSAFELPHDGVAIQESDPQGTLSSLAPGVNETVPMNFNSASHSLVEFCLEQEISAATGHGSTEVTHDSSEDSNDAKVYPLSVDMEFSEAEKLIVLPKEEDDTESSHKASVSKPHDAGQQELRTCKEEESCIFQLGRTKAELDTSAMTSSDPADAVVEPSSHHPSGVFIEDRTSYLDKGNVTDKAIKASKKVLVLTDPDASQLEASPHLSQAISKARQESDGKGAELSVVNSASVMLSEAKGRPSIVPARIKPAAGKKKKRREIFSKADATGMSDLYNAYNGPEEKCDLAHESESVNSSTGLDVNLVAADPFEKDTVAREEDRHSKSEFDDWEDAAYITAPKLRTLENKPVNGVEKHHDEDQDVISRKKYSRDFLLTFADQCNDLPVGFEILADTVDALISTTAAKSYVANRESYPSPGRIMDRSPGSFRGDRRMVGVVDDSKWSKVSANIGPGRDIRLDLGLGAPVVSLRPGQGVNHGVSRNPRGQGGILSGPLQSYSPQGTLSRNGADADRWQRATGIQRGLIPSPQTPLQVMHKAEKKYEVGKASDQEEVKQRHLKAILNKLTPQNFEKLFAQVKEVNIDNAITLTGVISQIFDKALMEPTFCEMYANFCFYLANELPDFSEGDEKITFKRLLLNKCQEEFERGEREQAEADKDEEESGIKQSEAEREEKRITARRRMLGNIRLIGELYKKKMLTERIMHECIKKLLGEYQNPDEEDIEALCKLMSTIGEIIDHPKAKEHMDAYFEMMLKLSTNQKLSSRVRFILRDAIDLRKNKWHQRRKVEGPKKIEEVHRDAAHERQAQASRSSRAPVITSTGRRGALVDHSSRGSRVLRSPSSQQTSGIHCFAPQARQHGTQDARLEDRHVFENRTLSVSQRPVDGDSITLGPRGALARRLSIRGQPLRADMPSNELCVNTVDPHKVASDPSGYTSKSFNSREDSTSRYISDRVGGLAYDRPRTPDQSMYSQSNSSISDRAGGNSRPATPAGVQNVPPQAKPLSEEVLREKSMSAIKEFYSAKDVEEVALCVKELNSPGFYPSMVSLWVTDSFERKDTERDLLSGLLVDLCKPGDGMLNQLQLIQGFESVLSLLEDAMKDAPRAAEFLGRLLAKIIVEDVVPLQEVGRLIREGGEEPGSLLEIGLASDVLATILNSIKQEKGDATLKEIQTSSRLSLEDFRPPHPFKSKKLDAFLSS